MLIINGNDVQYQFQNTIPLVVENAESQVPKNDVLLEGDNSMIRVLQVDNNSSQEYCLSNAENNIITVEEVILEDTISIPTSSNRNNVLEAEDDEDPKDPSYHVEETHSEEESNDTGKEKDCFE